MTTTFSMEHAMTEEQLLDEWAAASGRTSSLTSGLRTDLLQLIRAARESKEASKAVPVADERKPSDGDYLRWAEQEGAKVNWDFESTSSARVVFLLASQWGRFCDKVRASQPEAVPVADEAMRDALLMLIERCGDSDDAQYGTLSTSFVREVCESALANEQQTHATNEARLNRAAGIVATQAGQSHQQFVEWLCNGGLVEMALSHFGHPSQPEPTSKGEAVEELSRALAVIGVVGQIDGYDVIRRESVLEVAQRRRGA